MNITCKKKEWISPDVSLNIYWYIKSRYLNFIEAIKNKLSPYWSFRLLELITLIDLLYLKAYININ